MFLLIICEYYFISHQYFPNYLGFIQSVLIFFSPILSKKVNNMHHFVPFTRPNRDFQQCWYEKTGKEYAYLWFSREEIWKSLGACSRKGHLLEELWYVRQDIVLHHKNNLRFTCWKMALSNNAVWEKILINLSVDFVDA